MRRWLLVLSLWTVFAIRAHDILTLPAFVDESLHILRAQVVYDFSDAVASFLPGKLLTYYYLGLFGLDNPNALWLARIAIALLTPLSAGLCYAIVWQLTQSRIASLIALWLYALSPFMAFFERMALADPFVTVFGLAAIWLSLRWAKHPSPKLAIWTGVAVGLALLAKLTALPLLAVPILSLLFYGKWQPRQLIPVYAVAVALMLLPMAYVVYQEVAQLEGKQEVVTQTLFVPEERSRLEQISFNIETYFLATARLTWAFFVLPFAAFLVGMRIAWRETLYLSAIHSAITGFIVLASAFPSTRYMTLAFPLLIILVAVVGYRLQRRIKWSPKYFSNVAIALVSLWLILSPALSILPRLWNDPTQVLLGDQDAWEYFSHTSSGYGLRASAAYLVREAAMTEAPVAVISTLGNCHSIRFYFPAGSDIRLYCPLFGFYDNPALSTQTEFLATVPDEVYLLTEHQDDLTPILLPENAQSIAVYPRPFEGEAVSLYRISAERLTQLPDDE